LQPHFQDNLNPKILNLFHPFFSVIVNDPTRCNQNYRYDLASASQPLPPKKGCADSYSGSNDLWALAAAELSDEDHNNIDFSCPDKLDILSDLHAITEQCRQDCIKKRWGYTRKSGETVVFRDLFSRVIRWIDIFKQVGDAAVQYDPVHAALPWAGVRFLLQVRIDHRLKDT
jgi:hypothetical protein